MNWLKRNMNKITITTLIIIAYLPALKNTINNLTHFAILTTIYIIIGIIALAFAHFLDEDNKKLGDQ